jgi:hypothetical protein
MKPRPMHPRQRAELDRSLAEAWAWTLREMKFVVRTIEADTPWGELTREAYEDQLETLTQLQTVVGRISRMTWPPPREPLGGRPPAYRAGEAPPISTSNSQSNSTRPVSGDGPKGRFPHERSPR